MQHVRSYGTRKSAQKSKSVGLATTKPVVALSMGLLLMIVFTPFIVNAAGNNGAIWSNFGPCGSPQDVNQYSIGEHVFLNGNNFDSNESLAWEIKGKPGGASADPNIVVASGTINADVSGAFCFDAYTVAADDDGEYQVKIGTKGDNYQVDGQVVLPPPPPPTTPTATLTLGKVVVNDNVGTAVDTDWTLTATGPTNITGVEGNASVTTAVVTPGAYTLAESNGPAGYTAASAWVCSGATVSNSNQITLSNGDVASCTITNDDNTSRVQTATLTLVKVVTNNNNGSALNTDWTLSASGSTSISGISGAGSVTAATVNIGVYSLSESNGPSGYTAGSWDCNNTTVSNGNTITLADGDVVVCTITNDDDAPESNGGGGSRRSGSTTPTPTPPPGQVLGATTPQTAPAQLPRTGFDPSWLLTAVLLVPRLRLKKK
ncbi:MAG: hypothetical protein KW793_03120 [Candidatus Doudnabacteria bacterium]|nr:hypothetical protein [Candidatus Doudnabacteria bacterium]